MDIISASLVLNNILCLQKLGLKKHPKLLVFTLLCEMFLQKIHANIVQYGNNALNIVLATHKKTSNYKGI